MSLQHLLPRANQCSLSRAAQHALCHVSIIHWHFFVPPAPSARTCICASSLSPRCMYDNTITRCAENDFVKIFCIVSCLWIVGWPLKLMLGYDDSSSLTAYYRLFKHLFDFLCMLRCAFFFLSLVISLPQTVQTFRAQITCLLLSCSMTAPWNEFFYRNSSSIFAAVCMKVCPVHRTELSRTIL
jgi:hypothetical protein